MAKEKNQNTEYKHLLEVKDLHTSFFTEKGVVKAVNGLSFFLDEGKVLGIVGESGSGKSVSAYSVLRILADTGRVVSGEVLYKGKDLCKASEHEMRHIRGGGISIIFQDPMTSLNPTYTVGHQLKEAILLHTSHPKSEAEKIAADMLEKVHVNDPYKRLKQYPFELSGGMRQRVMCAMALVSEPDILIADEPTTALDVTIQAQFLDLLMTLQKEMGMAIIMITHDLGVIAQMADDVIVMYAGKACEQGTADEIFYHPAHEYTKGLMRSIPTAANIGKKLKPISGTPIDLLNLPKGCAFAPRCDAAMKICMKNECPKKILNDDHVSFCWKNFEDDVAHGMSQIDVENDVSQDINQSDVKSDVWAGRSKVEIETEHEEDK